MDTEDYTEGDALYKCLECGKTFWSNEGSCIHCYGGDTFLMGY